VEHILDYIGPALPIAGATGAAGWVLGKTEKFDFGEVQGLVVGIVAGLFLTGLLKVALS